MTSDSSFLFLLFWGLGRSCYREGCVCGRRTPNKVETGGGRGVRGGGGRGRGRPQKGPTETPVMGWLTARRRVWTGRQGAQSHGG